MELSLENFTLSLERQKELVAAKKTYILTVINSIARKGIIKYYLGIYFSNNEQMYLQFDDTSNIPENIVTRHITYFLVLTLNLQQNVATQIDTFVTS